MANQIFAPSDLLPAALDTAKKISANAPIAVRQAKQAVHSGPIMALMDWLAFEIEAYNRTLPTQDRREGVAAFNEKRSAHFEAR